MREKIRCEMTVLEQRKLWRPKWCRGPCRGARVQAQARNASWRAGNGDLCPVLQAGQGCIVDLFICVCLLQLAENSGADTFSSVVTYSFEISETWACHLMAIFP